MELCNRLYNILKHSWSDWAEKKTQGRQISHKVYKHWKSLLQRASWWNPGWNQCFSAWKCTSAPESEFKKIQVIIYSSTVVWYSEYSGIRFVGLCLILLLQSIIYTLSGHTRTPPKLQVFSCLSIQSNWEGTLLSIISLKSETVWLLCFPWLFVNWCWTKLFIYTYTIYCMLNLPCHSFIRIWFFFYATEQISNLVFRAIASL